MKILISVTLLLAMASVSHYRDVTRVAKSASEDDAQQKVTIYFERGPCLNNCAVFSLKIRPDRTVEYEGKEFARIQGKRTYTISAEAYKAILTAITQAKVERLADKYQPVPGRDAGTIIMRFLWNGKTKQIIHFLPSPDAPKELGELEDAIVKNAYPSEGRKS